MATKTPALAALTAAGIDHRVHTYAVGAGEESYGEAVAAALGVDPRRVFKTLVTRVESVPVVAIVPVSAQLSLKALARAVGGKRAIMATPADAERWTGYVVGGISPFGQIRRMPVYVDSAVQEFDLVMVSAGRRGAQVELRPADLVSLLQATVAPLADHGSGRPRSENALE